MGSVYENLFFYLPFDSSEFPGSVSPTTKEKIQNTRKMYYSHDS